MNDKEFLTAKYEKYNDGQLKLLHSNQSLTGAKREVITSILESRGVIETTADELKFPNATDALGTIETPEPIGMEQPIEKPEVIEEPEIVEQPEVIKKTVEETTEGWAYEIGSTINVKLANNRKERGGEVIEGEVLGRKLKDGVKEYRVKTEVGTMVKREKTLLKSN